jgi:protein ImuB
LLVDRLAARFGPQRILSFQPNGTHIPEAAWIAAPAQYAKPSRLSWTKIRRVAEPPRRPLRLFARPEPASLSASHLRWRSALRETALSEGPERIAMEWWRHVTPQPTRDYFRIEDRNGNRFWLYRDGIYGREAAMPRWFLHGISA